MIVLDTHAWIWWTASSPDLSARARTAIRRETEIGVCAISCWEVAMLVEKKRLGFDRDVLQWMRDALSQPAITLLELTPEIAVGAARLGRDFHGDPADRIIAATALNSHAPLVTKDGKLRAYAPLRTIW